MTWGRNEHLEEISKLRHQSGMRFRVCFSLEVFRERRDAVQELSLRSSLDTLGAVERYALRNVILLRQGMPLERFDSPHKSVTSESASSYYYQERTLRHLDPSLVRP